MTSGQTLSLEQPKARMVPITKYARLLYSGTAALLLVATFLGFQQFYLHGRAFPNRELTPAIRTLLIIHGISMTAWVLLFLVQPLLIVSRKRRLHMTLGYAGAVLAGCVILLGLNVAVEAARVNPPSLKLWGLAPKCFVAIPIFSIIAFGVYVAAGVWNRRRPDVHRPLMLLGSLAITTAAIDRIDAVRNLYGTSIWGAVFGPFFAPLMIGLLFLAARYLLTRSLDRWFAFGWAAFGVASAFTMQLAKSSAWEHITKSLLG